MRTLIQSVSLISLVALLQACGGAPSTPAGGETSPEVNTAGGTAPEATAAAGKKLTIGVMPKLIGIGYFNATERGAKAAGEELGVTVEFNGPEQPDVTQQAQMVETWITRGFDAIAIAPNNPDSIAVALAKAQKKNIPVITWDTDSKPESRQFFVNQASSEALARTLADIMAEGAGPEAKYLTIIGTLTAANQQEWSRLIEEYRAQKYPGMQRVADVKGTEEDLALATQVAMDSLKTYPDLNGIFALTSVSLPGAAEGLRKSQAADRVFLTGLALPSDMKEYVLDGTVKKFVLWNAEDLGYLTVYAATAAARGELKDGATEFRAGKLGTVKVTGSEILLGEPLVFDRANIEQYNF